EPMTRTLTFTKDVPLKPYTTLRAGGNAETLAVATTADELAEYAVHAQKTDTHTTLLGWGSNVLPSDSGVPGLVLVNQANRIQIERSGEVIAETGCGFQ